MSRARDLADGADKDITGTLTLDDIVLSNDMSVADNGKVQFGAGNDLQIYHDGSNSFIAGNNAANNTIGIKPGGNGSVLITNSSGDNIITQQGDAANLHYDGVTKLATTSTGVDVTGSAIMTGTDTFNSAATGSGILLKDSGVTSRQLHIAAPGSVSEAVIGTPNSHNLTFATNNTERLRIDSSGNVGIGTASPTNFGGTTLQTNHGSTYSANLVSSGAYTLQMIASATHGAMSMGARSNHHVAFTTNDTERMRITNSGAVGIGTTSPSTKIHLNESGSANAVQRIQAGTNGYAAQLHLYGNNVGGAAYNSVASYVNGDATPQWEITGPEASAEDQMLLHTGGSERMRIASGGNVGIGTSAPTELLHLNANNPEFTMQAATDGGECAIYFKDDDGNKDGRITYRTDYSGQTDNFMSFFTNNSEKVRIDGSGKVNIGTSAVDGFLQVKHNNNADVLLMLHDTSGAGGTAVRFKVNGSTVGSIANSASGTSFNTTSDHRLKEGVEDMTGAIDRVKALAPKRFNFIADPDTTVDGFLAHEAQAVVPEAITGTHNEVDTDGNAVMQGIDQSKLVPLLTGALREAITKIETLETKVAALEAAE